MVQHSTPLLICIMVDFPPHSSQLRWEAPLQQSFCWQMAATKLMLNYWEVSKKDERMNLLLLFVFCLFVDVRWLIGDPNHVQSNYFYGHNILYTVNGGYHEISGPAVFDDYHTYSIDWLGLCCNSRKYAHLCLIWLQRHQESWANRMVCRWQCCPYHLEERYLWCKRSLQVSFRAIVSSAYTTSDSSYQRIYWWNVFADASRSVFGMVALNQEQLNGRVDLLT